ncbi:hypothetical protein GCK32_009972 [Trichostrongylus colubriformis]|uniref:Beta-lactamase-related domain-containing protein n=1 Tax=Trichostrongylus colubriformis TaxID=6319 RepID=A0AAN8FUK6_TRICO
MDFTLSVYYLGFTKVRFFERNIGKNNIPPESYRSNEENVIDQIETAQLDGLLPMDANGLHKVMRIASISKPLTAAITARLVQDGKLDLDKPIHTYLPDFPHKKVDGKPVHITTRQLLSHTGGIRHYKKKDEEADAKKDLEDPAPSDAEDKEFLSNVSYASVTDALTMFKDDELLTEPGKKFKLSESMS